VARWSSAVTRSLGRGDRGLGVGALDLAAEALGVARLDVLELGACHGLRVTADHDAGRRAAGGAMCSSRAALVAMLDA